TRHPSSLPPDQINVKPSIGVCSYQRTGADKEDQGRGSGCLRLVSLSTAWLRLTLLFKRSQGPSGILLLKGVQRLEPPCLRGLLSLSECFRIGRDRLVRATRKVDKDQGGRYEYQTRAFCNRLFASFFFTDSCAGPEAQLLRHVDARQREE